MTTRGRIFVISAPSGGGKSSLISRVLKRDPGLTLATSHTSRPPRKGERDGREYHFVSHADFLTMRGRGQFVEWVRLHGNLYGTSRKELDSLLKEGRDILLDVDIRGGASVADIYPDSVSIFILPPSPRQQAATPRLGGRAHAARCRHDPIRSGCVDSRYRPNT